MTTKLRYDRPVDLTPVLWCSCMAYDAETHQGVFSGRPTGGSPVRYTWTMSRRVFNMLVPFLNTRPDLY